MATNRLKNDGAKNKPELDVVELDSTESQVPQTPKEELSPAVRPIPAYEQSIVEDIIVDANDEMESGGSTDVRRVVHETATPSKPIQPKSKYAADVYGYLLELFAQHDAVRSEELQRRSFDRFREQITSLAGKVLSISPSKLEETLNAAFEELYARAYRIVGDDRFIKNQYRIWLTSRKFQDYIYSLSEEAFLTLAVNTWYFLRIVIKLTDNEKHAIQVIVECAMLRAAKTEAPDPVSLMKWTAFGLDALRAVTQDFIDLAGSRLPDRGKLQIPGSGDELASFEEAVDDLSRATRQKIETCALSRYVFHFELAFPKPEDLRFDGPLREGLGQGNGNAKRRGRPRKILGTVSRLPAIIANDEPASNITDLHETLSAMGGHLFAPGDAKRLVAWANTNLKAHGVTLKCPASGRPAFMASGPSKTKGRAYFRFRSTIDGKSIQLAESTCFPKNLVFQVIPNST